MMCGWTDFSWWWFLMMPLGVAMDRRGDVVVPLRSEETERLRLEAEVLDDLEAGDGSDLRGLRPAGCVALTSRRATAPELHEEQPWRAMSGRRGWSTPDATGAGADLPLFHGGPPAPKSRSVARGRSPPPKPNNDLIDAVTLRVEPIVGERRPCRGP